MQHANPLTEELTALLEEKPLLKPAPLWRRIGAGVTDAVGVYILILAVLLSLLMGIGFADTFFHSFRRDHLESEKQGPLIFMKEKFKSRMEVNVAVLIRKNLWFNFPVYPFIDTIRRIDNLKSTDFIASAIYCIAISVIATFYSPFFDSSRLQGTPGKLLFRLKVSDESGQRLTVKKAYLRSAGKVFTFATLGFGFISLFFNAKKQTWYDKRFKTLVTARG